jgi:prolyl 4-hydroxylase
LNTSESITPLLHRVRFNQHRMPLCTDSNATDGSRIVHIRTVSTRPRVFEIPNFLSYDECDHLVQIARVANLEKSKVGGDTAAKGEYRDVRTSSQIWLGYGERTNTPVVKEIADRVFAFTQLPADVAESMQLVHYNTTQHYLGHHDYAHKWESTDNSYVQAGGNRFVTIIFYLNDVAEGGETAFPFGNSTRRPLLDEHGKERIWVQHGARQVYYGYEGCDGLGLRVRPVKGTAVLFYNLLEQHTWDAG